MRRVRDELTAHVGGKPSATQRLLIERCATLSLKIHLMDRAELQSEFTSEKNAREYLVWTNVLSRILRQIGMKGAPEQPPSIMEMFARPRSASNLDTAA